MTKDDIALVLFIGNDEYILTKLPPGVVKVAWRVTKLVKSLEEILPDGPPIYTVHVDAHGPGCTCQDATYRQRECKHILALQTVGLI